MSRLFAKAYARNAIGDCREACKEIVADYAHVYREPTKAVLIALSVMLMNTADYSYADYSKVKKVIVEMMEETR